MKPYISMRPLKNGNLCSSSRKAIILTSPVRSARPTGQAGIYRIFRGLKFEPDLSACNAQAGAEIGHKVPFCKGLIILTVLSILFSSVAFAERLAVSSVTANIRSGPGTNHDILWKVEKYHPLFILKKTNVWYHFRDFEEDEGWIHESLVNKTPTVITNSATANIRSGPGTKNKILFTVDKGIPFKILKRKGKWINIQHADGDKGWIHKSLVW